MARTAEQTREFLRIARERFKQAAEATAKQRQRELDDLAFYAGGDRQWEPEALQARKAQQASAGMPPVPARPVVTINKVREPVHQVENEERRSDMGIELVAADDFGGLTGPIAETEIELREGLVRRIQRESEASDARTWAFKRAVIAGTGYYGIKTRYVPGKTWDQELYVERFYNQAAISIDPNHEQPDGSDAEWGFEGADVPWDRYKAEYPRNAAGHPNQTAKADDTEFRALGEEYPTWFTQEGERRSARVVNYWYTERERRTLVQLADGSAAWEDELPETGEQEIVTERDVVQKSIKWAKIDATQILEETDWPGPDLPIIKVLGEELQPFDQERRSEGMVRPMRGAGQGFNAFISKFVETVGLSSIPSPMMAAGQQEGFETWWQARTTRTLPFLLYNTKDLEGNIVGKPEIVPTVAADLVRALAEGLQIFDEAVQTTTMVPEARVGRNVQSKLKSGVALNEARQASEQGTSHFLDNLRRSIRYEGQILNNLLFAIYGKPGRMVRIVTGEGESETIRVGPAPQNMGQPSMPASGGNGAGAPPQKQYALTKDANFNVIVKVTRGFDSRRDEEATTIGNLLQANPAFMGWFGDLFFKNQDGPGHEEMAERAKLMLDPKIQQMLQSKQQGGQIPPEAQAQIAQLQGQLQQAEQILQQAKQELEGKHGEQQAKLQIAQMQQEQALELQRMKDATALEVARIGAAKQAADAAREDEEEAIALRSEERRVGKECRL